jgi:hypothetical protein
MAAVKNADAGGGVVAGALDGEDEASSTGEPPSALPFGRSLLNRGRPGSAKGAYHYFCLEKMEGVKAGPPKLSGAAWQKAVVVMWHATSSEQRAPYELLAVEDKAVRHRSGQLGAGHRRGVPARARRSARQPATGGGACRGRGGCWSTPNPNFDDSCRPPGPWISRV